MQKKFEVNNLSTLPEILEFIELALKELKLDAKEINRSELMCEEALVKLIENGDFTEKNLVSVNVKKFLGDVSIELKVPGSEFNFYLDAGISFSEDGDEDNVEGIRNLVLRSFEDRIKYTHSKNFNKVKINVARSQYFKLYQVIDSVALAVITGVLMKIVLPKEICDIVNENVFNVIRGLFLNGLKMCSVPVVFFFIVSCFAQSSNTSQMKRMGVKLFSIFVFWQYCVVVIAPSLVWIFGTGKGANLAATGTSEAVQALPLYFSTTVLNFMTDNLVKPFFEGNMIQLITFGILIGIGANAVEAKHIILSIEEYKNLFMKIVGYFLQITPLVIFCSIASTIITAGTKTILSVIGILLTVYCSMILLNIIICFVIIFFAKLNPLTFYKKSISAIITGFSTGSSSATMPEMMNAAAKMGISQNIYALTIPLMTMMCNISVPMVVLISTFSLANMYGVEVSAVNMFFVLVSAVIVLPMLPSMPGAPFIAMSSFLSMIGCPVEGVAFIMAIEPIFFGTPTNVMGVITSAMIVAKSENQLDIEKYNS